MRKVRVALCAAVACLAVTGCGGSAGGGSGPAPKAAAFREMAVPVAGNASHAAQPGSWPDDLAGDAAGNIWFAMHHANEIGRMSPGGTYTGFPVPTPSSDMDSIVVDDVRRIVWVSEVAGNNIVRLDMDTGQVTELPVPSANADPGDLALAKDGTVWFVEGYDSLTSGRGRLARLDPSTNAITEIPPPQTRGALDGIAIDAGGAIWFAEFADNRIARYTGGTFTEFAIPHTLSIPTNIAFDGDGRLWVTEQGTDLIGCFDPATGGWTDYPIPTASSSPAGITVDAAGNVWFTETGANRIGVLPSGASTILEYEIPTVNSYPEDIRVIGGRVYFSERYGNKIAQISVPGLAP